MKTRTFKKSFICFLFSCLFLFGANLFSFGQELKGTLISAIDSSPIEFAAIESFDTDSALYLYTESDQNGQFSIKLPPSPPCEIRVSRIGFLPYSLSITKPVKETINIGQIILYPDSLSVTLDEVVILGSGRVQGTNSLLLFPSKEEIKTSRNVIDLLSQMSIPKLNADPIQNTVSVDGTSGVKYKINGIDATLDETRAIDPADIIRIEYNDIPPIRYADSNSAVINFIIKDRISGLSVNSQITAAFFPEHIDGTASIIKYHNKSQFSLNFFESYKNFDERTIDTRENFFLPNDSLYRNFNGDNSHYGYFNQRTTLGYKYVGDSDVFSAKLQLHSSSNYSEPEKGIIRQSFIPNEFNRKVDDVYNAVTPSLNLSYNHVYNQNKGLEVNLVGTFMNSRIKRELEDNNSSDTLDYIYSKTKGKRKSLIADALFYNGSQTLSYSFGLRSTLINTNNTYQTDIKQESNIDWFEVYPYAQINGMLKRLMWSLGVGMKMVSVDNGLQDMEYFKPNLTAGLYYMINNELGIGYNLFLMPFLPSIGNLNDVEQQVDDIYITQGNPNLKPNYGIANQACIIAKTNCTLFEKQIVQKFI